MQDCVYLFGLLPVCTSLASFFFFLAQKEECVAGSGIFVFFFQTCTVGLLVRGAEVEASICQPSARAEAGMVLACDDDTWKFAGIREATMRATSKARARGRCIHPFSQCRVPAPSCFIMAQKANRPELFVLLCCAVLRRVFLLDDHILFANALAPRERSQLELSPTITFRCYLSTGSPNRERRALFFFFCVCVCVCVQSVPVESCCASKLKHIHTYREREREREGIQRRRRRLPPPLLCRPIGGVQRWILCGFEHIETVLAIVLWRVSQSRQQSCDCIRRRRRRRHLKAHRLRRR